LHALVIGARCCGTVGLTVCLLCWLFCCDHVRLPSARQLWVFLL
jgi:hypothetical protein